MTELFLGVVGGQSLAGFSDDYFRLLQIALTVPILPLYFAFLSLFPFLAGSAATLSFMFSGVNVRVLCVVGFAVGALLVTCSWVAAYFFKKKIGGHVAIKSN